MEKIPTYSCIKIKTSIPLHGILKRISQMMTPVRKGPKTLRMLFGQPRSLQAVAANQHRSVSCAHVLSSAAATPQRQGTRTNVNEDTYSYYNYSNNYKGPLFMDDLEYLDRQFDEKLAAVRLMAMETAVAASTINGSSSSTKSTSTSEIGISALA